MEGRKRTGRTGRVRQSETAYCGGPGTKSTKPERDPDGVREHGDNDGKEADRQSEHRTTAYCPVSHVFPGPFDVVLPDFNHHPGFVSFHERLECFGDSSDRGAC